MDALRTSNGRYSVEQVKRLAVDPVFNARYSADEELNRLMNPKPEEDQFDNENAQCLGMTRRIMGVDVPPCTLGHIRILTAVGNECVKEQYDWSKGFEYQLEQLTEALFVLRFGSAAVVSFTAVHKWRAVVEKWSAEAKTNPALAEIVIEAERKLAEARAGWDAMLLRFAAKYMVIEPGCNYIAEGNALLDHIASAFDGFKLLPQRQQVQDPNAPQKKTSGSRMQSMRLSFAQGLVRLAHRLLRSK